MTQEWGVISTLVTLIVIALTVVVSASVWLVSGISRSKAVRATLGHDGFQEVRIVVDKGYLPDTVEVTSGIPARLRFWRKEDDPCSERVVFSSIEMDRRLPPFQETVVEFIPITEGSFLFTCQWGMYRGKLIVTGPDTKRKRSLARFISGRRLRRESHRF